MIAFDDALKQSIGEELAKFERVTAGADGLKGAAVAFTIVGDGNGGAGFLLTRRAAGLRKHASQWALPGGRLEPGEDPSTAALRELREEVGLALKPDAVLGFLDDYPTRSGFHIAPVVVWGGTITTFTPHEAEVESVHVVALEELEREPNFLDDPERPIIQVPMGERFIHAPTAAVLYQFRELCLHGRPTRVAHFDQPAFAWG